MNAFKVKYGLTTVLFLLCIFFARGASGDKKYDFVVDPSGNGDFRTVQEAINAVPDFRENETKIFIKNGKYKEKLVLPASKTNVTFIGESMTYTVLTYDDYASKKNIFGEEMETTASSSFFVFADDFKARNITFQNSAGHVGKAVAIRIEGDRAVFVNCKFLGNEDTLYLYGNKSRQYYKNCYIEGTIDFIFGQSTAVFESCVINCKGEGYITAASTQEETLYGFVFLNCRITGRGNRQFHLGRPRRPYAKTVFLNCYMSKHVSPEGWNNGDKPEAEHSAFYAEYNSMGPGANTEDRAPWSCQLNDRQAETYTVENILKGEDDWDPRK
ncbi:pectinesterase family protein [Sinomicrobium weinanense]|uniref:Pectinesterase n=1 Tax=Sinomicrobium weinanense TaxID=2842200 RepID=A0A926JPU7_9FLAO|nr:pectinesterase family protein [Sinomicrobium weinanense]MBC9795169.1 pectin esterase [Sinomicrobium weinanense]MBU3121946.1 pectin esterase [Sinomicrobium weinanense]